MKQTMRKRWIVAALVATLTAAAATPLAASPDDGVAELRRELEALRQEYTDRLAELEERLRRLEEGEGGAGAAATTEIEGLRAAARSAAEQAAVEEPSLVAPAGAGSLNRLNPEISFTGDVVGVSGGGGEDFEDREFELDLQAVLDPYSRTRWTLAFSPEEGVEIEEGWILYTGLPGGMSLKGGKFRQRFGPLNQQHLHALPQADYPLVLSTYFGEEGLAQTGVAFGWLLPRPWAGANEVIVEVTDGSSEAFGGEDFDRLVVLGRLKNFWDLGASGYLEWGLSGVSGRPAGSGSAEVLGTDLTLHWQPPSRAKYREVTWRTEVLRSERDDLFGARAEAWGGYSYVEALLRRNLYAGVRYDRVEDPLAPEEVTRGWFPSLTWWQSEYVRLRAQYGFVEGESDQFTLQLTWAAGPHKHEAY
jgi:hypothetical protein